MLNKLLLAGFALVLGPSWALADAPAPALPGASPTPVESVKESYDSQHRLLSKKRLYVSGKRHMLQKYCPSGELSSCQSWYEDGTPQLEVSYPSCGHPGVAKLFWPNGQLGYRLKVDEAQQDACDGGYRPGEEFYEDGSRASAEPKKLAAAPPELNEGPGIIEPAASPAPIHFSGSFSIDPWIPPQPLRPAAPSGSSKVKKVKHAKRAGGTWLIGAYDDQGLRDGAWRLNPLRVTMQSQMVVGGFEWDGAYAHGLRTGAWQFKMGRWQVNGNYAAGKREGTWDWKWGNEWEERGDYAHGAREGLWRRFILHGSGCEQRQPVLAMECIYKAGRRTYMRNLAPDGVVLSAGEMDGDVKSGDWMERDAAELWEWHGRYSAGVKAGPWVKTGPGNEKLSWEGLSASALLEQAQASLKAANPEGFSQRVAGRANRYGIAPLLFLFYPEGWAPHDASGQALTGSACRMQGLANTPLWDATARPADGSADKLLSQHFTLEKVATLPWGLGPGALAGRQGDVKYAPELAAGSQADFFVIDRLGGWVWHLDRGGLLSLEPWSQERQDAIMASATLGNASDPSQPQLRATDMGSEELTQYALAASPAGLSFCIPGYAKEDFEDFNKGYKVMHVLQVAAPFIQTGTGVAPSLWRLKLAHAVQLSDNSALFPWFTQSGMGLYRAQYSPLTLTGQALLKPLPAPSPASGQSLAELPNQTDMHMLKPSNNKGSIKDTFTGLALGPGHHSCELALDSPQPSAKCLFLDAKGNTVLMHDCENPSGDQRNYHMDYMIEPGSLPDGYVYDMYFACFDSKGGLAGARRMKGEPVVQPSERMTVPLGWYYMASVIYSATRSDRVDDGFTPEELAKMPRVTLPKQATTR